MYSSRHNQKMIDLSIELLSNCSIFLEYGMLMIQNWPITSNVNLTCSTHNKIAWIGQATCNYYCGAPEHIVRQCWNTLNLNQQKNANRTANLILNEFNSKKHGKQGIFNF